MRRATRAHKGPAEVATETSAREVEGPAPINCLDDGSSDVSDGARLEQARSPTGRGSVSASPPNAFTGWERRCGPIPRLTLALRLLPWATESPARTPSQRGCARCPGGRPARCALVQELSAEGDCAGSAASRATSSVTSRTPISRLSRVLVTVEVVLEAGERSDRLEVRWWDGHSGLLLDGIHQAQEVDLVQARLLAYWREPVDLFEIGVWDHVPQRAHHSTPHCQRIADHMGIDVIHVVGFGVGFHVLSMQRHVDDLCRAECPVVSLARRR